MMKLTTVVAVIAASLSLSAPSYAWVGARGGGFVHGPAGGTMAWHGAAVGGAPRWGYGDWRAPVAVGAGAVAGAAAAGAVAGAVATRAVIGARYTALPVGCLTVPASYYYACDGVYYRPYYGPNGVVYETVPAP